MTEGKYFDHPNDFPTPSGVSYDMLEGESPGNIFLVIDAVDENLLASSSHDSTIRFWYNDAASLGEPARRSKA